MDVTFSNNWPTNNYKTIIYTEEANFWYYDGGNDNLKPIIKNKTNDRYDFINWNLIWAYAKQNTTYISILPLFTDLGLACIRDFSVFPHPPTSVQYCHHKCQLLAWSALQEMQTYWYFHSCITPLCTFRCPLHFVLWICTEALTKATENKNTVSNGSGKKRFRKRLPTTVTFPLKILLLHK